MFEKVLVANRGEIAIRIIRACRELGMHSVAVFSEADRDALHVELADEAICIGPPPASESYLKIANVISAAEVADVDAIHPGYGFLAENAHFAEICENCNICFIGPSADNIRRMGDKAAARETMKEAGVPVTPGSDGVLRDQDEALELARAMGYPVLIKAVAGGGGKGMRVAHNDVSLVQGYLTAGSEAERSFGNPDLYMEKYVERARHIEVQVIGDRHGGVVHLGERDCSIQRRHQKLVEEAPSPALTPEQRRELGAAAVRAAQFTGYSSAGTLEFLYDEAAKEFYFMEMNTRIQVEHPVTEQVTGVDIIKEQIRVATGEPLSFSQEEVRIEGHSIEFRVNAEDPQRNFSPSPGRIEWLHFPGGPGVRIDSQAYAGADIPPYYDSMIAKLIVDGRDREEAIARMRRAMDEFTVDGLATTLPLGLRLMADPRFQRGEYHTGFLERFLEDSLPPEE
ncbi:acetyl-CoA carboxylase biotin carboxylase subunit [Kiritimatiella glycovorans]|uniref:Biotin carboxylase n=1 Tax=Kiritimatiella glycovorans TaxID=1307763 RepID=A0A0G3EIT3_9BACT|nr:acetyl-CoA carboxylase biotin carboxylase subunit [Kiritimatiella glycovorans]AKJ64079.1 Biotin carboxylase [Kiritimatiella glycovorans]